MADKHMSMAKNTLATTEKLLEVMFSVQSMPRLYKDQWDTLVAVVVMRSCETVTSQ
jgi:hypothetical protein